MSICIENKFETEKRWLQEFTKTFPLPKTYCILDIETTGKLRRDDLVLQIGHVNVVDCKEAYNTDVILNWADCRQINLEWLKNRIIYTTENMMSKGKDYRFNYQIICKEGKDPLKVLSTYHNFIKKWQDSGGYFAGHNVCTFDFPFLEANFSRFLGSSFKFDLNRVIDTGLIEKSVQAMYGSYLPLPGESLEAFYRSIYDMRGPGKIFWNLVPCCVQKYGLEQEYELDLNQAHLAGFDSHIVYLLIEKVYRKLAEEACT